MQMPHAFGVLGGMPLGAGAGGVPLGPAAEALFSHGQMDMARLAGQQQSPPSQFHSPGLDGLMSPFAFPLAPPRHSASPIVTAQAHASPPPPLHPPHAAK